MRNDVRGYWYKLSTTSGIFLTFDLGRFCQIAENIYGMSEDDLKDVLGKFNDAIIRGVLNISFHQDTANEKCMGFEIGIGDLPIKHSWEAK